MINEYINAAINEANYSIIEDEYPFYADIPSLKGLWASGSTFEECRRNLIESIESWLIVSLKNNLEIPELNGISFYQQVEELV
ncbi:MAG: type II toxin-antitoxin system HicB family antitoxin [Candidatus Kapabacteria bacterium]|nr:type II toxin-antitoxin system HicB family antitoxin [Candidatus Kapabacteria bacterium]